jgi:hypothetical protein
MQYGGEKNIHVKRNIYCPYLLAKGKTLEIVTN